MKDVTSKDITFNNPDLAELAHIFGCGAIDIGQLVDFGVKVDYGVKSLVLKDKWDKALVNVPIKKSAVQHAMSGVLGTASLHFLAELLDGACDQIKYLVLQVSEDEGGVTQLADLGYSNEPLEKAVSLPPVVETQQEAAMPKHKIASKLSTKGAIDNPTGAGLSVPNMGKVLLANATELYQPVHGSSSGSVYHAIALTKGLNVAVRIKNNNNVSLRAEGDLSKWAPRLTAAGFVMSNTHASVHVNGANALMARRVVGALLMSLGVNFTKATFLLDPVDGKGV